MLSSIVNCCDYEFWCGDVFCKMLYVVMFEVKCYYGVFDVLRRVLYE